MSKMISIDDIDRHYFMLCNCGCGRYFEFVGQMRTGMRIVGSNEKELNVKSVKAEFSEWKGKLKERTEDTHMLFSCDCGECETEYEFVGHVCSEIVFMTARDKPLKTKDKPIMMKNWRRYQVKPSKKPQS